MHGLPEPLYPRTCQSPTHSVSEGMGSIPDVLLAQVRK